MTSTADFAFPMRPGEPAHFRVADAADRDRLDAAFVRAGLRRGHMVVYLCAESAADDTSTRLRGLDDAVDDALARGQIQVRDAQAAHEPDGTFDIDRMLETIRDEHARAVYHGYTGLSLTGDVDAALSSVGADRVAEYERRLERELVGGTQVLLCRYDHGHADLAAAGVRAPETLGLAGELDYESADDLATVLDEHFSGPRRLDLADLSYVDVSAMRALRGRSGQPLTIAGASEAVRRLVDLLGWDTDPAVEVAA
jgi:ABC-type transporter Mla MlaB component